METDFLRESSPGYMTNWASRLFARAIDRQLKPHGLSSGQLPVLFALGNGGALSQKHLVAAAEIEQPTMAALLGRMERDGLVQRRPDPQDGRGVLFSLTEQGLEKVPAVRAAIATVNDAATGMMSASDRDQYLGTLSRIVGGLQEFLRDD